MSDTRDLLPEMLDPTDVCSAMDDLAFMEYCYSHFDVNLDHKVGLHEARAVREIDLSDSKVVSLRGIEYFSNLERLILDRTTVKELHLLQNTKLKEISAKGCAHLNLTKLPNGLSVIPNNEIWYTSSDGKIIEPRHAGGGLAFVVNFGATIISNSYENSKGIITFDGDIISIEDNAFKGCTSLTSITLPDSVTEIGGGAFKKCTSLTSVTIGNSVTSIGEDAFSGCTSLTSITLPDSVTSIGSYAFSDCSSLASVTIGSSVTTIGMGAFYYCTSLISVTIPDSVTKIGRRAFDECSSLTSVTIGSGITEIGDSAFYNCSSLTSVTIPDRVTSIGNSAFNGCTSLTSFYGKYASNDGRCLIIDGVLNSFAPAGLTEYTIPNSVTKIGSYAFSFCKSLTSITIPDSVTMIGECAFSDFPTLTSVYCEVTIPPVGSYDMFMYIHYDDWIAIGCTIYVPRQSVEAYKSAKGWKEYANAIVGYDFEAEKKSVAVEQMDKSPYYLFFDTETTGLPKNFKAPASETYNWPRMVQLAWIVANKQGDILKKKSCIIRPEGYTISSSAVEVHGITTEKALREGESLKKVLAEFGEDLAAAKVLVAHNMAFDKKIVHAEYIRLGCEDVWTNGPTERICTMMSSIDYCALPGFYDDYKWPKLQELHKKLFGYEFDDAHDALADVEATYRCYWQMRKLGLIE